MDKANRVHVVSSISAEVSSILVAYAEIFRKIHRKLEIRPSNPEKLENSGNLNQENLKNLENLIKSGKVWLSSSLVYLVLEDF